MIGTRIFFDSTQNTVFTLSLTRFTTKSIIHFVLIFLGNFTKNYSFQKKIFQYFPQKMKYNYSITSLFYIQMLTNYVIDSDELLSGLIKYIKKKPSKLGTHLKRKIKSISYK